MKCGIWLVLLTSLTLATANELIPVLQVKDEVYKNVSVTEITATDVYFTSAQGMGNAKLKNLTPELQKHFHYDPTKSAQTEQAQIEANVAYRKTLASAKNVQPPVVAPAEHTTDPADDEDFVAPRLYAASIRGKMAPRFVVEKWLTPIPPTAGKFVLIDFWATWCRSCRESIPELNAFHAKYKDQLVVIGISSETSDAIQAMKDPRIDYAVASDTKKRMGGELEISGIPHCILIDPNGFVRYEGMPQYLDDQKLEHFLTKYGR